MKGVWDKTIRSKLYSISTSNSECRKVDLTGYVDKDVEKIYDENADNPWLTSNDIKEVANSEENLVVTSRKFNNYKRSKTNKEVVQDSAGRKEKNIYI